jgi:hypothetical protein
MVCIQCYLPPILFMIYMKLLHPFLAPFIEPAFNKVIAWIWGPQALNQGCPIRPKDKRTMAQKADEGDSSQQPVASSSAAAKDKHD